MKTKKSDIVLNMGRGILSYWWMVK